MVAGHTSCHAAARGSGGRRTTAAPAVSSRRRAYRDACSPASSSTGPSWAAGECAAIWSRSAAMAPARANTPLSGLKARKATRGGVGCWGKPPPSLAAPPPELPSAASNVRLYQMLNDGDVEVTQHSQSHERHRPVRQLSHPFPASAGSGALTAAGPTQDISPHTAWTSHQLVFFVTLWETR